MQRGTVWCTMQTVQHYSSVGVNGFLPDDLYSCIFSQLLLENPTIISTVQCSNFQNIGVTGSETFAIFHFR
jgi:hypothetical protein